MFDGLQIIFSMVLGGVFLTTGIRKLTNDRKRVGWGLIAIAIVIQLWWVHLFIDEASRTRTDSEGTYIVPRGSER